MTTYVQRVLRSGVTRRVGRPNQPRRTARDRQLTLDRVTDEKVERNPGQVYDGKNIQLKQFTIDFYVDRVPGCPLRSSGVVDQDVQRLEVIYDHVEVVVVMVDVQHVHLEHVHVVRAECSIGLGYCFEIERGSWRLVPMVGGVSHIKLLTDAVLLNLEQLRNVARR